MSEAAADTIFSEIAALTVVAEHRPWPRHVMDDAAWLALARALGRGAGDLLGLWADDGHVHAAVRCAEWREPRVVSVPVTDGAFPSVGQYHPPALRLERAIRDLYGLVPSGHPDERPWLDHGAWGLRAPLGARRPSELADPADYPFLPVRGHGLHQIPVGPVHAGIIEPGHFRFTANGETVVRLEERLGYVHKGADDLLTGAELEKARRIIGRISGDSTVAYAFAFALAVEAALEISVPPRARVLRGVMAELERIANHLGDIGAICNDAAFTLNHAHCGILREQVLAACGHAFGHRLMMDCIAPGGVAVDLSPQHARSIVETFDAITPWFADVVRVYDGTPSLQDRTCGTGIVHQDLARRWAAGGFVGRASGRAFDARRELAYPPYEQAQINVPVLQAGDVDARVWIRVREIDASVALLRQWLSALPDGEIRTALPSPAASCEGIAVAETFRGDVLVWVRFSADGRIARCHARDPSWFQWPLLEAAIEGNIVADFPLCNKSFNCSYSGHDL
jgi:Ni,Fe-hydrogenase III large subunit